MYRALAIAVVLACIGQLQSHPFPGDKSDAMKSVNGHVQDHAADLKDNAKGAVKSLKRKVGDHVKDFGKKVAHTLEKHNIDPEELKQNVTNHIQKLKKELPAALEKHGVDVDDLKAKAKEHFQKFVDHVKKGAADLKDKGKKIYNDLPSGAKKAIKSRIDSKVKKTKDHFKANIQPKKDGDAPAPDAAAPPAPVAAPEGDAKPAPDAAAPPAPAAAAPPAADGAAPPAAA